MPPTAAACSRINQQPADTGTDSIDCENKLGDHVSSSPQADNNDEHTVEPHTRPSYHSSMSGSLSLSSIKHTRAAAQAIIAQATSSQLQLQHAPQRRLEGIRRQIHSSVSSCDPRTAMLATSTAVVAQKVEACLLSFPLFPLIHYTFPANHNHRQAT